MLHLVYHLIYRFQVPCSLVSGVICFPKKVKKTDPKKSLSMVRIIIKLYER